MNEEVADDDAAAAAVAAAAADLFLESARACVCDVKGGKFIVWVCVAAAAAARFGVPFLALRVFERRAAVISAVGGDGMRSEGF